MAAKKDFKQCAHCGIMNQDDEGITVGFKYRETPSKRHSISCICGILTKQFASKEALQRAWNSRPGKVIKAPVVTVGKTNLSHAKHDDLQDEEF